MPFEQEGFGRFEMWFFGKGEIGEDLLG